MPDALSQKDVARLRALREYLTATLLRDVQVDVRSAFTMSGENHARKVLHGAGACAGSLDRSVDFLRQRFGVEPGDGRRLLRNAFTVEVTHEHDGRRWTETTRRDVTCDCEVLCGLADLDAKAETR